MTYTRVQVAMTCPAVARGCSGHSTQTLGQLVCIDLMKVSPFYDVYYQQCVASSVPIPLHRNTNVKNNYFT